MIYALKIFSRRGQSLWLPSERGSLAGFTEEAERGGVWRCRVGD